MNSSYFTVVEKDCLTLVMQICRQTILRNAAHYNGKLKRLLCLCCKYFTHREYSREYRILKYNEEAILKKNNNYITLEKIDTVLGYKLSKCVD